jgi:hypothetical protein
VRAHAVERLKRKHRFLSDLGGYVTVNAVLRVIWAAVDRSTDGLPRPAWVSMIWGFFLLLDALHSDVRRPAASSAVPHSLAARLPSRAPAILPAPAPVD